MWKIYHSAGKVLIWLGPDTKEHLAKVAIDSIVTVSDFICKRLGIPVSDLRLMNNVYEEVVAKNRDRLPLPNECEFSTNTLWESLIWFYCHPYFGRVWAIQEVNANRERLLQCGYEKTVWDRVSLVAGYITMETALSRRFGFSKTYCWWAASMTTDLMQPRNWLHMLYLVSNFSSLDPRDAVYGLRGLMKLSEGGELLNPDYNKSTAEVYRDSVEAALVDFKNIDVLLYVTGSQNPSWIPRWDQPMLFRNPFRFGKAVPWKPSGESKAVWSIDKKMNTLSLSGILIDSVRLVESYNERFFGNAMIESDDGRASLRQLWQRILQTMQSSQSDSQTITISVDVLTAAAASFSFGLDEKSNPADEHYLLRIFIAYLKIALHDEETYKKYIPSEISEQSQSKDSDGYLFGKPVWDFAYPESSFFITEGGLIGCSISEIRPGDVVCVALGSTYPLMLRQDGNDCFLIRGYAYVHGIMRGERWNAETKVFRIS